MLSEFTSLLKTGPAWAAFLEQKTVRGELLVPGEEEENQLRLMIKLR